MNTKIPKTFVIYIFKVVLGCTEQKKEKKKEKSSHSVSFLNHSKSFV